LRVLAADDAAMREIEDALQNAERSADDVATAVARMTLGNALVHRQTDAQRDYEQKLLTGSVMFSYAGDTTRAYRL
jgi:hypothetical protein